MPEDEHSQITAAQTKPHEPLPACSALEGMTLQNLPLTCSKKTRNYIGAFARLQKLPLEFPEKVLLLTRTTRFEDVEKKTDGLTLFLTDLDRDHVDIRPIRKMGRNAVSSNELFIDDLRVPEAHRVGEEGQGFRYILDGLNPERMLVAAEALGLGRVALRRAVRYGNDRVVFGRPIGMNQGLQFPLADSLARLDAAELALRKATWLYDNGKPCGREANTAKYLCADAGFDAADRALQTHGGMGYSEEYHVARYFREARLLKIAPLSQEMVLNYVAGHSLGLPKSY